MADYVNVPGSYSGTSGNDTFVYSGNFPPATVDALDGFDRVTVDFANSYSQSFSIGIDADGAMSVNAFRPFQQSASFSHVESVTALGSANSDNFSLDMAADPGSAVVSVDGRAGLDQFFLNYRLAGPLSFITDSDGTATASFGTFTNIENFIIQSSATANTISLGNGSDQIIAAGTMQVTTGGGDDIVTVGVLSSGNIIPTAATGTIDGGAGFDRITATIADGAAPITLSLDATTLSTSTGLTLTNFEQYYLTSGTGDDAIAVTANRAVDINGGAGVDSFTYDLSDTTAGLSYQVAKFSPEASIDGSGGNVFFHAMEHVTMRAGSGDDTFRVSSAIAPSDLILDGGGGTDLLIGEFSAIADSSRLVVASDSTIDSNRGQFAGFERFELYGGIGVDTFTTGAGDDLLDGGGGDDVLAGGAGDDSYVVRSSNAQVTESANAGIDSVTAYASFTLGANIENLTLKGDSVTPIDGTGNDIANVITGTNGINILRGMGGDDFLVGGAGGDQLDGGTGSDTADYQASNGAVSINLAAGTASGGFAQGDTLTSIENLRGSSFGDTLIGNDAANRLEGFEGDDVLVGGTGADALVGGTGKDVFRGTAAELNGDTIVDLSGGDRISISDATLAGFSFTLTGNTLIFTGGSLTLGTVPTGSLYAAAGASGGVDILVRGAIVQNDFNGDGRSDILWRSNAGQLSDWLGQASGGFVTNDTNAMTGAPTNWHVVGTGDFNGDGRSDILWRSDSGQLSDWLANANGSFAGNDANAMTQVSTSWHVAGTGDFNGDGRSDILWRSDSGQLSDWLANANGGFASNDANAMSGAPTSWKVAGTGDFNGDGRTDILWRNDNGQLSDWLGQANGGFASNDANAMTGAPTSWHVAGTGDFNGDGRTDILWRNDAGQLSDWLGQANGGFAANDANALTGAPTSWHVVETGDYNGDGRDDILWRNDSGQLSNWLANANGGFASNDANALTQVSTSWQTQPVHDFIV